MHPKCKPLTLNFLKKYIKSPPIKGVTSTVQAKPKEMLRAETRNKCTAGTDTNHSRMIALLLE